MNQGGKNSTNRHVDSRSNLDGIHAMQTEIYGFVGWITSMIAYVFFLLWAYLPDEILESYGITYYPSKYWAIALPAYLCVAVGFAIIIYEAMNMILVPPLNSPTLLSDIHSKELNIDHWEEQKHANTPEIADIPISVINKLMYQ